LAAKNLQIDSLPLLVTPHPLNDLTPDEVLKLAQAAYPVVIRQLTSQAPLEVSARIDFIHPAERKKQAKAEGAAQESKR